MPSQARPATEEAAPGAFAVQRLGWLATSDGSSASRWFWEPQRERPFVQKGGSEHQAS
jgi:hypothetical protein